MANSEQRANSIGHATTKCESTIDPAKVICDNCWRGGLPCSFTTTEKLRERDDVFYEVLYMSLKKLEICKVIDIEDPGFVNFDVPEM